MASEEELRAHIERLEKRLSRETESATIYGQRQAAEMLLDVVDDCDRAIAMLEDHPRLSAGLAAARDQIIQRFSVIGLEPFASQGDSFDPNLHEAISLEKGDPGKIISVHRRGWRDADGSILRAAMVTVGGKP